MALQLCGSALAFYHPSELDTDLHQSVAQRRVGLLPHVSVKLTHPHNLSVDQHGKGKTGTQPGPPGAVPVGQRYVRDHIHTPLWLAGGDHAPDGAFSRRILHGLRGLLERHKARWRVEMPNG